MRIKKLILLCVLQCGNLFFVRHTIAMENIDLHVKTVRGQIDQQILGIADNKWYTSVVGSITSFYCSASHPKQAIEQLCKVESIIKEASDCELSPLFFEELRKHWHFDYLINALVNDEVKQWCCVKGSTIDDLLE